jgi:hypothetical protein
MAPHRRRPPRDRGAAGRPGASRPTRRDARDARGPDVTRPPNPIEAARAALRAALDAIDAQVTRADELLRTAGERKALLVEQELAALA